MPSSDSILRRAASVHGSLHCVSCHADLEGKELPHGEELAPVDCGTCHDAIEVEQLLRVMRWTGRPLGPP